MVTRLWLTFAQASTPLWLQLDRRERFQVAAALGLILLLGGGLIVLAWGPRATRRYIRRTTPAERQATPERPAPPPPASPSADEDPDYS